jgi:hypothetical protein
LNILTSESEITADLTGYEIDGHRVPEIGEEYVNPTGRLILVADVDKLAVKNREKRFVLRRVGRVVFEVTAEPTIQIVFSDKPLLELPMDEARLVFRQLEELV